MRFEDTLNSTVSELSVSRLLVAHGWGAHDESLFVGLTGASSYF